MKARQECRRAWVGHLTVDASTPTSADLTTSTRDSTTRNEYLLAIIYLDISSLQIVACNCKVSVDVLANGRENILHRVHFLQARVL